MNFCIFDVITYSDELYKIAIGSVVIWWIFVSLMWLHTAIIYIFISQNELWFDEFLYLWCDYIQLASFKASIIICCDLMNFCIFDVITYSSIRTMANSPGVVIWWIFVSLMWLHTALTEGTDVRVRLWFDEFLYLWCDYIQLFPKRVLQHPCCDLMNFCIFDVITYSSYGC